jgi:hypothetical protein
MWIARHKLIPESCVYLFIYQNLHSSPALKHFCIGQQSCQLRTRHPVRSLLSGSVLWSVSRLPELSLCFPRCLTDRMKPGKHPSVLPKTHLTSPTSVLTTGQFHCHRLLDNIDASLPGEVSKRRSAALRYMGTWSFGVSCRCAGQPHHPPTA